MPDNPEGELEFLTDGPPDADWTLILDRRRGPQLQAAKAIRPHLGAEPAASGTEQPDQTTKEVCGELLELLKTLLHQRLVVS
jgi:hypothetical protein